jgi:hypothetical protein
MLATMTPDGVDPFPFNQLRGERLTVVTFAVAHIELDFDGRGRFETRLSLKVLDGLKIAKTGEPGFRRLLLPSTGEARSRNEPSKPGVPALHVHGRLLHPSRARSAAAGCGRHRVQGIRRRARRLVVSDLSVDPPPFDELKGAALVSVSFVLDSLSFCFGRPYCAAFTPVVVRDESRVARFGEDRFYELVCEQIGKTVARTERVDDQFLRFVFVDAAAIEISLRPADYVCPEAVYAAGFKGGDWIVH